MTRQKRIGIGLFLIGLLLVVVVGLGASTFARTAGPTWTGRWDTRWRDGGAQLYLAQEGRRVTGSYPLYGGRIEAEAAGRELRGHWIEGKRSGGFLFVIAPDGNSFAGRYDNGEWWTGGRVAENAHVTTLNQSTPRETFRTFVSAGNMWRAGRLDEIGTAAAVLDFGPQTDRLLPGDKLDAAQRLFVAVDQTTFRIWTLPGGEAGPQTTPVVPVTLQESGTGVPLTLTFRREDGNKWWIVVPGKSALDAALARLLARDGGQLPAANAYLRLGTPRDTMRTFLRAFDDWDGAGRQQALSTLDLSGLALGVRTREGELAAEYLKKVLDRIGTITPQEIPDDPQRKEPYIHFEHPAGRIVIAPVGEGAATRWLFTADTVRTVRDLYAAIEQMPAAGGSTGLGQQFPYFAIRDRVRAVYPALLQRTGSMENWQILALLGILAGGWAAAVALAGLFTAVLPDSWQTGRGRAQRQRLMWPLRIAIVCALWFLGSRALGLPDVVQQILQDVVAVGLAASVVVLGMWSVDLIGRPHLSRAAQKGRGLDEIVVALVMFLVKLALVVAASLYVAGTLSIPYAGVIASLSLGGLALALASKEMLADVFGTGMLLADPPFRRGDAIIIDDTEGIVEEVGIRSTRIRTVEGSVLVVPNSKLADSTIANFGSRHHRLMNTTLVADFDTTSDQLIALTNGLHDLVGRHPNVVHDRTHAAVHALKEYGIEVGLSVYIRSQTASEERAVRQELLLDILRLVERLGVKLALPTAVRVTVPSVQAPTLAR